MLKNNKAIYILIPLNIFIWGYFIYRFCGLYSEPASEAITETAHAKSKPEQKSKYVLSLNYRDPFLNGSEKFVNGEGVKSPQKEIKSKEAVKTTTITVKQIPSIQYLGLVKNNVSGTSTALISLNGQSKIIRTNEIIEGMVFKSFNKDSLVARWGREQIVVKR